MQRKPTKKTRGPNAQEKAFQAWLKEQPCAYCGAPGASIVDHARGSCFRHNHVLVGHWFCTSKCVKCDSAKTQGSHNEHFRVTSKTESAAWFEQTNEYWKQTGKLTPDNVDDAMTSFGLAEQRRYAA